MARPRSAGRRSETSRSPISTRPEERVSSPAMMRSSVVLPQPEGPSKATNSPSATVSDTSSSAFAAPNNLPILSMTMPAMGWPPSAVRDAPKGEQVAADGEDEDDRGHDEHEATGEAVMQRGLGQHGQQVGRERALPDREDGRGEH